MIDIQIFRDAEGHICGYSVAGHRGKHGSSIVCAGISVLAQSALKGIGEHLSRSVDFHVESGDLRIFFYPEIHFYDRTREWLKIVDYLDKPRAPHSYLVPVLP